MSRKTWRLWVIIIIIIPYITAYKSNYLVQNIILEDGGVDLSVDFQRKCPKGSQTSQNSSYEKSN